ncbi:hypothetical protein BDV38DRAFT_117915 [Aspergillus pseudotamarii]|uniref:Uncharacterized protein n=1 Tax=Aspergillus pseudotamarii TaxID=132259 RepID=A0A5N6SR07_ASPPS|nr:uncharacterized protein BDV38DRAFT_117915 [Aspergillus pseudotamarii]KAE8136249.1 hypothetical protein BDV38DRAFT_117915 [Aspergillus pseudotamarii]
MTCLVYRLHRFIFSISVFVPLSIRGSIALFLTHEHKSPMRHWKETLGRFSERATTTLNTPLQLAARSQKIYKVLLHALVTNVGYRYKIWQPGPRCELTIVC